MPDVAPSRRSWFAGGFRSGLGLALGLVLGVTTTAVPAALPVLAAALVPVDGVAAEDDLPTLAKAVRQDLEQRVIPYWVDTTIVPGVAGYVLADPGDGSVPSDAAKADRSLVTQARLVWTFSHLHRLGFTAGKRDLLAAARHGVEFLNGKMWDNDKRGYYWQTTPDGTPVVDRKHLYGQAFAIYALVEWHRASGDPAALARALELFRLIQDKAHDGAHEGWFEDHYRDWKRVQTYENPMLLEPMGLKGSNTHLHLMEAFAELADDSRDPAVLQALDEAVRVNQRHCFPAPDGARFSFADNWLPTGRPGISPGHNVEYAWLLVRAEEVLGRTPSWDEFTLFLDHTMGWRDWERGGLIDPPRDQGRKVWWSQAELIAALSVGLAHDPKRADWAGALAQTLRFAREKFADPKDGVWFAEVARDGTPTDRAKAHAWKANYHDLRALVKVVQLGEGLAGK